MNSIFGLPRTVIRAGRALLLLGVLLALAGAAWAQDEPVEARLKSVAGLEPAEAKAFFQAVQDAVAKGDKTALSKMVDYPFTVRGEKSKLALKKPADFVAKYDLVINAKVKAKVAAQTFEKLFVNSQGVMFGDGEIWFAGVFDKDGKVTRIHIIAINN